MTALSKLLRTTAFKLTLVYLTVFALFAAFLLGYFAWNTRRLITDQITQTVDAEITGLSEQSKGVGLGLGFAGGVGLGVGAGDGTDIQVFVRLSCR